MSHITVALIKIESNANNDRKAHSRDFKYLVITKENQLKFWDYTDGAINGSFRRDSLQRSLERQFEVTIDYNNTKFDRPYKDPKHSDVTYLSIEIIDKDLKDKIDLYFSDSEEQGEWLSKQEIKEKLGSWIEYQKFIIEGKGSFIPSPPEFPNSFKFLIEQIQNAQQRDKLVLFVGSGISNNSGVPFWSELINQIKTKVDIPDYESDYLVIPQLFFNEVGDSQYHETIQEILLHNRVQPSIIHSEILRLKPIHIITTNYDNLIEKAVENEYKPYSVIRKDSDLPTASTSNYIIKMHGDFDECNIVLKEDDYLNYSGNFPLIENFMKGLFSSATVLFIGFSFSDINLKYILERVRSTLKDDFKPAILFSDETVEDVSKQKLDYFKKRGIQILNYDKGIEKYLKNLNEWKETKFGIKGQRVFEFLKFLRKYDRFINYGSNTHPVDKMYSALRRFDEIKSIPPKIVAKLPPFALSMKDGERAKYRENGCHLRTMNESIIELVDKLTIQEGRLKYSNGQFEFTNSSDKEEIKSTVSDLDQKLFYIFSKLNSSGINCLQRANDRLNSNHFRILLPPDKECTCPKCLLSNLKFSKGLENIANGKYLCRADNESVESSMNLAFTHFQYGNFVEAYEELKRAGINSLQKGWFAKFFLIQYNIVQLKFIIKSLFNNDEISPDYKGDILSDINDINLYDLLSDLPYDNLVKEVLEELVGKKWFGQQRRKIEKELREVKKIYLLYDKKGNRMGYAPYDMLLYNYAILHSFYVTNRLFDIAWQEFEDLSIMLWDGTLFALRTNSDTYGLSDIQYYLFDKAIFHIQPKNLLNLFRKHDNPKLKVHEKDQEKVMMNCINFFNSNHKEINVFGTQFIENKYFEIQKNKSRFFEYKCRQLSGTILILMSHVELSNIDEDKKNELLESMLNYVLIEGCGMTFDSEYLGEFIRNQISLFSNNYIDKIYKTILSDNLWSDRLLEDFCDGLAKEKVQYKISDEALYNLLIKRTSPRRKYNVSINRIDFIKPFLSKNLQKKFDKLISETK